MYITNIQNGKIINFYKKLKEQLKSKEKIIKKFVKYKTKYRLIKKGWQLNEIPIHRNAQYTIKTRKDLTSGIETSPGVTPSLWPPNQYDNESQDIIDSKIDDL